MRGRTGYLFRAYSSKGVSHQHLNFGRDSKAAREVEKFIVEDRGGFRHAVIGANHYRRVVGRVIRSGAS